MRGAWLKSGQGEGVRVCVVCTECGWVQAGPLPFMLSMLFSVGPSSHMLLQTELKFCK